MMESWNVIGHGNDFVLLNAARTLIRFSKHAWHVRSDISWLLGRMEERGVPIKYTDDLEEIYITILKSARGDYCEGKIRLGFNGDFKDVIDRTLIHELGHHVDDMEDISSNEAIIDEKRRAARHFGDKYARKNVGEYIAIGFEIFYCGMPSEKSRMRRYNKKLYSTIARIHRKYRAH